VKKLRLSFDREGLNLPKDDGERTPAELSSIIIRNMIIGWATSGQSRGLNDDDRRKYYKICDAFDAAIKNKAEEVELDDEWMGFIRKAKKDCELIPNELLRKVEANIEAVKDR